MKTKVKSFGISYHNHIFFIIIFCISLFDDSEETATHTDEEDRESFDKSDNEFSYSDNDSETECYYLIIIHPRAKTKDEIRRLKNISLYFRVISFFGGSVCDSLCRFTLN